jgi:hypothetical protein
MRAGMLDLMSRGHLAAALAAAALALAAPSAASANSFPLVGWWPMNEGSGPTVRDWSGRGNNGQLGKLPGPDAYDPTWIRGVLFGSGLRFENDDYVSIPASPALEPAHLTVAAWIRGSASPGNNLYIVAKGGLGCDRASYGLYTGTQGGVAFYIGDSTTFYRSPEVPATVWDGRWHHVAGTFDGQEVNLYVDGRRIGTGTPAQTSISYSIGSSGGAIGDYPGDCDQSLNLTGDVDGVQIWSRALPVDAIWRTLRSLFSLSR